jgi:hypothetical protein
MMLVREGFGKSHPGRLAGLVESLYSERARPYSTGSRLTLSAYYSRGTIVHLSLPKGTSPVGLHGHYFLDSPPQVQVHTA